MPYRPTLQGRIRAFLFTDRVGHTIATTIGISSILRWWIAKRMRERRASRAG